MKILVIDDSKIHQQSAQQTLGTDHDLTVVGSHDEALKLTGYQYDKEWKKMPYPWDVVLCDLLMPAGKAAQGGPGLQYVGQEMPVGWALAVDAALCGAKYVAVVTDMNHHHHPASAMLDRMGRTVFALNGSSALFTNHAPMVGIHGTEEECQDCHGTGKKRREDDTEYECCYCTDGVAYKEKGKDWGKILDQLLAKEGKK